MVKNKNSSCAIFISSCDTYDDAWEPFFTLFFKYWPDCPFPIFLIANEKKYNNEKVRTITISPDFGWAKNLALALRTHPYEYILYFQEDYFLKRKVNTEKIQELIDLVKKEHSAYLRLYSSPGPDVAFKERRDVGEILTNSPHRTSLQVSIWDTAVLKKMLEKDERAVDFELHHNEEIPQKFLSVKRSFLFPYLNQGPFDYICTGIQKRKWNRAVIPLFKKENITIKSGRAFETRKVYIKHQLSSLPLVGILFKQFYRVVYKIETLF